MSENGVLQALHFLNVIQALQVLGSNSRFHERLFDEVADCEVNTWKRTCFEGSNWEDTYWKVAIEETVLRGLFVKMNHCLVQTWI